MRHWSPTSLHFLLSPSSASSGTAESRSQIGISACLRVRSVEKTLFGGGGQMTEVESRLKVSI